MHTTPFEHGAGLPRSVTCRPAPTNVFALRAITYKFTPHWLDRASCQSIHAKPCTASARRGHNALSWPLVRPQLKSLPLICFMSTGLSFMAACTRYENRASLARSSDQFFF